MWCQAVEIYVSALTQPKHVSKAPSVRAFDVLVLGGLRRLTLSRSIEPPQLKPHQVMHRVIYLFSFVSIVGLVAGCKSSEAPKEAPQVEEPPTYVELAESRFGKNAEFVENSTGEFILVVSKPEATAMDPHPQVSFFIYGKKQNQVTYQSEVIGSVTWLDEYHLEVVVIPGIVKADSDPGGVTYRIDARTGSRVEVGAPARRR